MFNLDPDLTQNVFFIQEGTVVDEKTAEMLKKRNVPILQDSLDSIQKGSARFLAHG